MLLHRDGSAITTGHGRHSRIRRFALLMGGSLIGCTEPTSEFLPRDMVGSWAGSSGTVDVQLHVSHSVTTKTEYLTGRTYQIGLFNCRRSMSDSRVSSDRHPFVRPPFEAWAGREHPMQIVSLPLAGLSDGTYVYGYSFIGRPASKTVIPGHIYRTSRRRDEPPEATGLDSIGFTLHRH